MGMRYIEIKTLSICDANPRLNIVDFFCNSLDNKSL